MYQSVRSAFTPLMKRWEGCCPYLYLDVKGLVTTAVGNLVDTPSQAIALPFKRKDGTAAGPSEIVGEWLRVKSFQAMRFQGGYAYAKMTTLRLTNEGVAGIVERQLDANEKHLTKRFPDWNTWPADAQLAIHSLSWACGPHFRFAVLEHHLLAGDFSLAAGECHISEHGNPGVKPRNVGNEIMLRNAAWIVSSGWDRSVLHYPVVLG